MSGCVSHNAMCVTSSLTEYDVTMKKARDKMVGLVGKTPDRHSSTRTRAMHRPAMTVAKKENAAKKETCEGAMMKRWLTENECFITSASARKAVVTHLLMDGGRVHVPDALGSRFLAAYAESILAGERLYVVEQRTEPTFRMFCEFDFRTAQKLDDEGSARLALRVGAILQKDVFSAYVEGVGPEESKAMVTYCPCSEEKPGCYKVGMHFNWRCDTTLARAIVLRRLAVQRFSQLDAEEFGFDLPTATWNDVVDASVYDKCGLRLLYSRKNVVCATCKGRPFVHVKPATPTPDPTLARSGGDASPPQNPPSDATTAVAATATAAPTTPDQTTKAAPKPLGILQRSLAPRKNPLRTLSPVKQLTYVDSVVVCPACQGRGRVDCGRLYKVATVLDANGERDDELGARCATDLPFGIRWSSIRGSSSLGPNVNMAPLLTLRSCPVVDELTPAAEDEARKTLTSGPYRFGVGRGAGNAVVGIQQDGGDAGAEPIDGYMEDVTLDPKGLALAEFVRKNEPGSPEAIAVKMYNGRAGKVPGVTKFYVVHTSCHYCQNKEGEHQSSQVYFVATPAGITQRCFSQKGVVYERSQTTCSNYRSDVLPWRDGERLLDQLFGNYSRRCANKLDRELRGEPPRTRTKRTRPAGNASSGGAPGQPQQPTRPPPKRTRRGGRPPVPPPRHASPPPAMCPATGRPVNEFEDMLNGLDSGTYRLNGIS